jgi:hypothetical protein
MSFRIPAYEDEPWLVRTIRTLVDRFLLPIADRLSTSALLVLAVPIGCIAIVVAMLGAAVVGFLLPDALWGRVMSTGFLVGVVAAVAVLIGARSLLRRTVRRAAEARLVGSARAIARSHDRTITAEAAREALATRRQAILARLTRRPRQRHR